MDSSSEVVRLFRSNWGHALVRSPAGVPLLPPEFVVGQGPSVHLIDLREADELTGVLGHVPGVDWVPLERAESLSERLDPDAPVVLISRGGERASQVALQLERAGMRFVAVLQGGMLAWRNFGFVATREPEVLERRDHLQPRAEVQESSGGVLSREQVEAHVGGRHSVRRIRLAALLMHAHQSCVDGRDGSGVMGTPGGDAGEFLLGLAALERVTGEEISHRVLSELLRRRLDLLGQFYLHTDLGALGKLAASMQGDPRLKPLSSASDEAGWRQLFDAPPAHAREAVLSHAVIPEHLGCGHLRLTLQHSEDYGVRPALAEGMLQAFHRVRWEGSVDVDLVTLPGGHHEGAVVNVRTAGELWPFTPVPLVSPSYGGTQMFVNHPQVSHYLRTLLAQFLVTQGDLLPTPKGCREALEREMAGLAETQLAQTLGHLARGLPVYDVTFERDDVRVEYRGKVG